MNAQSTSRDASLIWFRDDLRLGDNPALAAAVRRGAPVAGLFVLEDAGRPLGGAARWKLHGALQALERDLSDIGIPLILRRGAPLAALRRAVADCGATAVFWNRRYAPDAVETDRTVKAALREDGVEVESANAALLVEPVSVSPASGGFYRVFSPFCKAARAAASNRSLAPVAAPDAAAPWPKRPDQGEPLDSWALRPTAPDWSGGLAETWDHGEAAAKDRLARFIEDGLPGYGVGRDRPGKPHVSSLSPHLRFGEISPRQVRHAAAMAASRADGRLDADFEAFERELYWRDFGYNLLFHADDLTSGNFQPKFDDFPWRTNNAQLRAWQKGQTGYPIVDAGMRQLWRTGWMHNRARMVVASFLTKHLLIDWREGEAWFWDTLVDADPASNPANWQWVAGSGADAAPFFRIFNPIAQGERFDADGAYVRQWVPELGGLPDKFLQAPWTAPEDVLEKAGVVLDRDYPSPIVEHKAARARALAAYDAIKG